MEPENTLCPDGESKAGVLAHLERLEAQVIKESALRTKIRQLRRHRDQLRAEVKLRQAGVKKSTTVEPDRTVELSEQEVLERQRENVTAILQAYRFTGLSGKLTRRGVCVCISTAFEGALLDSYFVDLVIEKPLWIHHHSVPAFIPLEKIAAQFLQTDVQRFLFTLSEYLNAYSGRKYQADRLQSDFAACLAGPLQRNALNNLLSFTYKNNMGAKSMLYCARLLYKDLTKTLPTDVTVTYQGEEALSTSQAELQTAQETLFCTKPIHQVFASFSQVEKLDSRIQS
ncbi:centromere protein O isoform X1 [Perognathus longimembris pacificus]|uniref:centromere protein O isoform X1 n=1 Tax=Perognathus longimembris pacificus TaxID=214514 RepID=UPI002019F11A|nr:centromere protein O isoform X1 [Perognathus longimembris pacificus]